MGCGQSQFSLIYPRKSKKKGKKNLGDSDDDDDEEDAEGGHRSNKSFSGGRLISNKSVSNLTSVANEEEIIEAVTTPSVSPARPTRLNLTETVSSNNSPLFVNREMTTSQKEFFELLDQRIHNGPDYDEKWDTRYMTSNVRMKQLLNEWEKAKTKYRLTETVIKHNAARQTPPLKERRRILQHGFTTPHLNGDVIRSYPFYYSLRQQQTNRFAQTPPPADKNNNNYHYNDRNNNNNNNNNNIIGRSQSTARSYNPTTSSTQVVFSNTIIQYDQLKGNFYTELA